jgi:Putative porin
MKEMKTISKRVFAVAGVLALGLTAVKAQSDGALLDALVKKGVLSDQEAEDIRADEAKDYSTTSAGKLALPDYVKKLTIYGDVRYRFEYADEKGQNNLAAPAGPGAGARDNIVERNRYRLRVGADYVFTDNFKGGVELESNTANDSANQTLGNGYAKSSIFIGLAYLQWKPVDWATITGGKMKNPLYSTDLEWDPDINPEGAAESLSWTFPIGGGSSEPVSHDPKDVKAVSAPTESSDMSLTVGLTGFQGIYADNQEFAPVTATNDRTDVWQFVEQVPVQFNFDKNTFVKIVPGFDTYTSGGNAGPSNATSGGATENGGGTQNFTAYNAADDLALVTAPGEFDWKMWDQPFKFYWDFVWNSEAKDRVNDVYLAQTPGTAITAGQRATQAQNKDLSDGVAWLAGLQVGQNKKKGDWSLKGDFRQVGLGSIDPNLNDSDWGDSFLNMQGIKVAGSYNFTDFLLGTITVYEDWHLKENLLNGTPGQDPTGLPVTTGVTGATASSITNLAGASQVQRVDVDLQWKF